LECAQPSAAFSRAPDMTGTFSHTRHFSRAHKAKAQLRIEPNVAPAGSVPGATRRSTVAFVEEALSRREFATPLAPLRMIALPTISMR